MPKIERLFARAQVKMPAVIVSRQPTMGCLINDLSSTGIAFTVRTPEEVPETFDLEFVLHLFSRPLRGRLQVMNRVNLKNGQRIGCKFVNLPEADQKKISGFICEYFDLPLPRFMLRLAAFLLSCDALWRIVFFLVNLFYSQASFAQSSAVMSSPSVSYAYVLIMHALCAFGALILVDYRRSAYPFLFTLLCLFGSVIFLVFKNAAYAVLLFNQASGFIAWFSIAEHLLVAYCVCVLIIGMIYYNRISRASESFARNFKGGKKISPALPA